MVIFKSGDLFETDKEVEAYVNPVNCMGVMGKGLALEFKKKFPVNYERYKKSCVEKKVHVGQIFMQKEKLENRSVWIFNFPTKNHWKHLSSLSYIESGLNDLVKNMRYLNIKKIAMPALGCGLGGLSFGDVEKKILKAFAPHSDLIAIVYKPHRGQS